MSSDTQTAAAAGQAVAAGCGAPVPVGYARLLNAGGDFVAEVPLGEDGGFRFFAAPGDWTVRVLAPGGISADLGVSAATGEISEFEVAV